MEFGGSILLGNSQGVSQLLGFGVGVTTVTLEVGVAAQLHAQFGRNICCCESGDEGVAEGVEAAFVLPAAGAFRHLAGRMPGGLEPTGVRLEKVHQSTGQPQGPIFGHLPVIPCACRVTFARMIDLNLSGTGGRTAGNDDFCVLRIELEGIQPAVWRSVIVPKSANLGWVHAVIQVAMGWTNSHLHQFRLGDRIFSDPTFDLNAFEDDPAVTDENTVTVDQVSKRKIPVLMYEYDFGDSWNHLLSFSPISKGQVAAENRADCLEGSRACPPEDCGGIPGYENLLEALGNKKHPEHRAMKQWLGRPYDPEAFAVDTVNRSLAKLPWPQLSVAQLGKILAALRRAKA